MNGECERTETPPKKAKLSTGRGRQRAYDKSAEAAQPVNKEDVADSSTLSAWIERELDRAKSEYERLAFEYQHLENGGTLCELSSWVRRTSSKIQVRATIPTELLNSDLTEVTTIETSVNSSTHNGDATKDDSDDQPAPRKKSKRVSLNTNVTEAKALSEKRRSVQSENQNREAASPSNQTRGRRSLASCEDEESSNAQEQAVHELQVLQRVRELRSQGVWSPRKLQKSLEPRRPRAHHDMLHEEMVWMSNDFDKERKWKQQAARRIAGAISRHFRDAEQRDTLATREAEQRTRRVASLCARRVREFWNRISTLADYKRQSFVEEKQKRLLDLQLDFIVSQTERYSTWLSEGLSGKRKSTRPAASSRRSVASVSDGDATMTDETASRAQDEAEADGEFDADEADSDDDESSLSDQERAEKRTYDDELRALEEDADEPIEDLLKRYSEQPPPESATSSSSESSSDSEFAPDEKQAASKGDEAVGTIQLLSSEKPAAEQPKTDVVSPAKAADEVQKPAETKAEDTAYVDEQAAAAAACQPTGTTLDSTHVHTAIPFLLHGRLREYQHVGLDWLATMYDKKLNGILADEMGLGKTIQTIALLAHLACERGVWGPHLIVVPTSVMLNWRVEFIKWAPAFKLLTYYGSLRERREKRRGWTKTNAFHVCITSYKLAVQDHSAFRRKKWKYLILDEAHNIKNFKSQRWQQLLTLQSQRRLLLTGTPLQNSLSELWSLMHFLMPHLFASHADFSDWFVSPLTGMIEGSQEYNEGLVRRLHKVLRPFLLRRLKADVEKQMPNKYEHVLMCALSKRQRFLYEDFMAQANTRETLASGRLMGVLNVLMQLRKVCNHPNLFEPRPTIFSFVAEPMRVRTHSMLLLVADQEDAMLPNRAALSRLCENEFHFDKHSANRVGQLRTPRKLIEEVGSSSKSANANSVTAATSSLQRCDKPLFPLVPANQSLLSELCRLSEAGVTDVTFVPASFLPDPDDETADQPEVEPESALNTSLDAVLTDELEQRAAASSVTRSNAERDLANARDYMARVNEARSSNLVPLYGTSLRRMVTVANPFGVIARLVRLAAASTHQASGSSFEMLFHAFMNDTQSSAGAAANDALHNVPVSCTYRGSVGYVHCLHATHVRSCELDEHIDTSDFDLEGEWICACRSRRTWWTETSTLSSMVINSAQRLDEMGVMLRRFVFAVPTCVTEPVKVHVAHAPPGWQSEEMVNESRVRSLARRAPSLLSQLTAARSLQFPETRLIEYDCGKLQTLNNLLQQLKAGGHRVLIFTQMSRMLDILEQFLSYHGYVYLRLDGTTRVEQRQILMERFNEDTRIFCFILSTRSGGLGVNLTGADTVVFYDSDWNPSMDAQAQDRCHRIGQTRDVHIYRLICERTVEENILKKANQKRLLNEMAIEHGRFVVSALRQNMINDLFQDPSGLEELATGSSRETTTTVSAVTPLSAASELQGNSSGNPTEFTQLLCELEDAEDATAAKQAADEQQLELVEFDESVPLDVVDRDRDAAKDREANRDADAEGADYEQNTSGAKDETKPTDALPEGIDVSKMSKAQLEFKRLTDQLRPIELYALKTVEAQAESDHDEGDSEDEFERAKQDFELSNLIARREEEEMHAELDDEMFFTCSHDQLNQADRRADDESEADDNASELDNDIGGGYSKQRRGGKASRGAKRLGDSWQADDGIRRVRGRGRPPKWRPEETAADYEPAAVQTFGKRGRPRSSIDSVTVTRGRKAKKFGDDGSRRAAANDSFGLEESLSSSMDVDVSARFQSSRGGRGGRARGRGGKLSSSDAREQLARSPEPSSSAQSIGGGQADRSAAVSAGAGRCTDVVKASFFRRMVGGTGSVNAKASASDLRNGGSDGMANHSASRHTAGGSHSNGGKSGRDSSMGGVRNQARTSFSQATSPNVNGPS